MGRRRRRTGVGGWGGRIPSGIFSQRVCLWVDDCGPSHRDRPLNLFNDPLYTRYACGPSHRDRSLNPLKGRLCKDQNLWPFIWK